MNFLIKFLLNHFDVITFDVFDTLIQRIVPVPSQIFQLVGQDILGENQKDSFFYNRIFAEKKARKKRYDSEVSLAEIYEEIKPIYGDIAEDLMRDEIDRELNSCLPKQLNVELMRWCLQNNKKVFLISDMYLSDDVLIKMLDQCNITGYKKLYVSNVYRKSKTSGDLFRVVIEDNRLNPRQIFHIGDSLRADVLGAWKANIFSLWLPRYMNMNRKK